MYNYTAMKDYPRCKTCKHWSKHSPRDFGSNFTDPIDPDTGYPMEMLFEVRVCGNPKLLFCERPLESNGFSVADGSNYMANLITAENFGCIHHEEK